MATTKGSSCSTAEQAADSVVVVHQRAEMDVSLAGLGLDLGEQRGHVGRRRRPEARRSRP
jgi:hypothetical protein